MKNIRFFYLKIFLVLVVNFSIYLNRCVSVMPRESKDFPLDVSGIFSFLIFNFEKYVQR